MKITISSLSAVVLLFILTLAIPVHASVLDAWEQFKVPGYVSGYVSGYSGYYSGYISVLESNLSQIYGFLFYGSLFILIFRLATFSCLSFIYTFVKKSGETDKFLKISIIIPAYNEEITISSCIKSMLSLNYPCYEVIVVDDGSSDNTFNEASKYAGKGVKIIRQENTGKPGAINTGIKASSGEIVITVDADSKLDPDALKWINRRFFSNPRLGAVAGNVKIDKPNGLLKNIQALEYTSAINLGRKSQSLLHCVMIVPGAIAALKTQVLREVGYFPVDTFAEDFDITMKILQAGYQVEYESHAIAFTQAPESIEDIIKQRRRWQRGMTQVLAKYQKMYLNPKYGIAGILGVPYMWLELSSSLINMVMLFTLLAASFYSSSMVSLTSGMLIYWTVMVVVSIYAVLIDPLPSIKEIVISPLYLFYSVFIDGISIMAFIEETLNLTMRWEKPKREELG